MLRLMQRSNLSKSLVMLGVSCRSSATASERSAAVPENQEGGIASASSSVGQQHQRVQMRYNKVNNIALCVVLVTPFVVLPFYYRTTVMTLWGHWRDPYELPNGFDPNKDPPPGEATLQVRKPKSMMAGSCPGTFSIGDPSRSTG